MRKQAQGRGSASLTAIQIRAALDFGYDVPDSRTNIGVECIDAGWA